MTSRERVLAALRHQESDLIPIDFGGAPASGIHVSCVAALRDYYGPEKRPVRERCRVFSRNGGFVFNSIHNIQARTPVENIVAMIEIHEFE